MNTWKTIENWYRSHGFSATAEDMAAIKQQWVGNEAWLLRALQSWDKPCGKAWVFAL